MYFIEKNINRLKKQGSTFFLNPKELKEIKGKLKKDEYNIYYPYKDSEKVILYKDEIPEVFLFEIIVKIPVRHQDILGSLFSISIAKEMFGDILIIDNHYYIYILPMIRNYFESNFLKIKNSSVELKEIDISSFRDYERSYEKIECIVSSNRIDTVISALIHVGRSTISDLIKRKSILLNHDFLKDVSYKLKEGDIFSIKQFGKYKFKGVVKETKKNHFIIEVQKYL